MLHETETPPTPATDVAVAAVGGLGRVAAAEAPFDCTIEPSAAMSNGRRHAKNQPRSLHEPPTYSPAEIGAGTPIQHLPAADEKLASPIAADGGIRTLNRRVQGFWSPLCAGAEPVRHGTETLVMPRLSRAKKWHYQEQ